MLPAPRQAVAAATPPTDRVALLQQLLQQRVALHETARLPVVGGFHGYEDLILRHGRFFPGRPRPAGVRRRRPRACFTNALDLARQDTGLTYVEGYALAATVSLPVVHAWCIDPHGHVIDVTWSDEQLTDAAYAGLPMPVPVVLAARERNHGWASVLDSDWLGQSFFLREGWRTCVPDPDER